jgi:hypothetical protein
MDHTEQSADIATISGSLRTILKSQYHAALEMLGETIERCPEDLWYSTGQTNAFWQVAYHTLFFTHLYMQTDEHAFRPWEQHQANVQHADGIPGPPDPNSTLPLIPDPYTKEQVIAYWRFCVEMVNDAVDAIDLFSSESGFHWYKVPKLEHQIINIRHIQHGAAQLADRLRAAESIGVNWAGARRVKAAGEAPAVSITIQ